MRQIEHNYPKQVKILDDPYLTHLCAQLSTSECQQPKFNQLVKRLFQHLFIQVINNDWPQTECTMKTRMTDLHDDVRLKTQLLDQKQKAVCLDVARAGMLPSQIFFDELNQLIDPAGNRQDHVFASRATNEKGEVTHTELSSSKIGGDVNEAIVLIPDPMGATGSSLCEVIQYYKDKVPGQVKKFIAVHMILTPEYIKKVTTTHPDVVIYGARLDRGFSTPEALATPPGTLWEQEKGLNENQYIVPGAGGVGELINNSFV
ncbi:MAG: uracil phosphoribosyltransferase [Pseudomonadota bacterium]